MLNHKTYIVAISDPLRYLMIHAYVSSRTSKWIMLLTKFDLEFVNLKSIKVKVIANQLAEAPLYDSQPLALDFPDDSIFVLLEDEEFIDTKEEYFDITLFFYGSKCKQGSGAGIVFITPQGAPIPLSFKLKFSCTNNMDEYEALVLGLQIAIKLNFKSIKIISDSQLFVKQVLGTYQCHNEVFKKYKSIVDQLLLKFDKYTIESSSRSTIRFADTIVSLGSLIPSQDNQDKLIIHIITLHNPSYIVGPIINQIEFDNANPWYALVKYFLKIGIFPQDMTKTERRCFKQKCAKYTLLGHIMHKRGYEGILLRYLEPNEIPLALSQAYDGACGLHFSGILIAKCLLRMG